MPEPNWACAAGCNAMASPRARAAKNRFFTESSLETLWNGVVGISRKEHVLREIHFHAVSLPNRDSGRDLTGSGDDTQSDRGAEDLKIVVVDLVLQSFLSDLVEPVELVEIDGITVLHDQTMKHNGHPALLAEACGSNLLCFTQNNRSFGNDDVLVIVRIHRV